MEKPKAATDGGGGKVRGCWRAKSVGGDRVKWRPGQGSEGPHRTVGEWRVRDF